MIGGVSEETADFTVRGDFKINMTTAWNADEKEDPHARIITQKVLGLLRRYPSRARARVCVCVYRGKEEIYVCMYACVRGWG